MKLKAFIEDKEVLNLDIKDCIVIFDNLDMFMNIDIELKMLKRFFLELKYKINKEFTPKFENKDICTTKIILESDTEDKSDIEKHTKRYIYIYKNDQEEICSGGNYNYSDLAEFHLRLQKALDETRSVVNNNKGRIKIPKDFEYIIDKINKYIKQKRIEIDFLDLNFLILISQLKDDSINQLIKNNKKKYEEWSNIFSCIADDLAKINCDEYSDVKDILTSFTKLEKEFIECKINEVDEFSNIILNNRMSDESIKKIEDIMIKISITKISLDCIMAELSSKEMRIESIKKNILSSLVSMQFKYNNSDKSKIKSGYCKLYVALIQRLITFHEFELTKDLIVGRVGNLDSIKP